MTVKSWAIIGIAFSTNGSKEQKEFALKLIVMGVDARRVLDAFRSKTREELDAKLLELEKSCLVE